jgi:hypothetical protein
LPQGVYNPTNVRRFDGAHGNAQKKCGKIFPSAARAATPSAAQGARPSGDRTAYMKKASNPANIEPAINVDQSPVSSPRRRPSVATRTRMAPSFYSPVLASDD